MELKTYEMRVCELGENCPDVKVGRGLGHSHPKVTGIRVVPDANPERAGNGCMIYRTDDGQSE